MNTQEHSKVIIYKKGWKFLKELSDKPVGIELIEVEEFEFTRDIVKQMLKLSQGGFEDLLLADINEAWEDISFNEAIKKICKNPSKTLKLPLYLMYDSFNLLSIVEVGLSDIKKRIIN